MSRVQGAVRCALHGALFVARTVDDHLDFDIRRQVCSVLSGLGFRVGGALLASCRGWRCQRIKQ